MVQALQCPASWMDERSSLLLSSPHSDFLSKPLELPHQTQMQLVSRLWGKYSLLIQDWEPDLPVGASPPPQLSVEGDN